jgi:ATP-dependent Clp protease ATP-binding subunit ClpX
MPEIDATDDLFSSDVGDPDDTNSAIPAIDERPLRAAQIRAELDTMVVGQVEAKERLSFLLSMHQAWDAHKDPLHAPPNGLIIGPTGSGKTFSIQVASQYLGNAFLIVDATTLVPAGAQNGNTIESVSAQLKHLVRQATKRRSIAATDAATFPSQRGTSKAIVFFDEFDKLAVLSDDVNKRWKQDVQRMLLKFVESHSMAQDGAAARGLLVLAGGAFVGIDGAENVRKRRAEVSALLRGAPKGTVVADDVVNYGFMPELVARLPAIIQYDALPEEALFMILQHTQTSPLLVWKSHFERIGKTLEFTDGFLRAVAKRAAAIQMGARGLQQIVFPALSRKAYAFEEAHENRIVVSESVLDFKE